MPVSTPLSPGRPFALMVLRYLGVYLVYLSTLVRALALLAGSPWQGLAAGLLLAYGALLALAPRLAAGRGWRRLIYLLLQSGLVAGLQAIPPRLEVLSTLFIPLSLQAVLLCGRKLGAAWIGAFILAILGPVRAEFGWSVAGAAMVLLYGSLYVLMGYYAALIERTEAARAENERLIHELQAAHASLQEHASHAEERAAAQERRRMARELHDSATQTIFGMNLAVQTARMLLARQPERVPGQLDRLQQLAHAAGGEIQVLVKQLPPLAPAGRDLPAKVRQLAAERAGRDGLAVRVEVQGQRELPEPVQAGLCRILQEALNNVAKHSGACEAVVRLNLAAEPASLEVEDHGIGFDPGAISLPNGHVGLAGMAERAREIGWQWHLDTCPGCGTRIRVAER